MKAAVRRAILAAMSEENIEIVRRWFGLWNAGDLDGQLDALDSEFEFRSSGVFPGLQPSYNGREGYARFWRDFRAPWQSLEIVLNDVRENGDDLAALFTFQATGREGIAVRRLAGNVFTIRNGLIKGVDAYGDWGQTLEAAGLSE
jgi:ketosteroid isomerase-like protein